MTASIEKKERLLIARNSEKSSTPLRLLAVFAHPDDEACVPGGTLAKYGHAGVEVTLLCATRGEAGEGKPNDAEDLGRVREWELRCSAQTLGIHRVAFLGCADGRVALCEMNTEQRQATEEEIVRAIRSIQPQVVLTLDPEARDDQLDHLAIAKMVTSAFLAAGDPQRFAGHLSEGLKPHRPSKLYYVVRPGSPIGDLAQIDVTEYLPLKARAIECHRTQTGCQLQYLTHGEGLQHREYFRLAYSRPSLPREGENDLFAGLR